MKNIIKKGLILFLFSLLAPIQGSSQTTLDSIQSKTLCLILNEHEKLSIENPLLKQQINSLEKLNSLYIQSDSIQKLEIEEYQKTIDTNGKELESTKKKLFYTSIGGIVLFIIGLIL
jgi:hypothetical protein